MLAHKRKRQRPSRLSCCVLLLLVTTNNTHPTEAFCGGRGGVFSCQAPTTSKACASLQRSSTPLHAGVVVVEEPTTYRTIRSSNSTKETNATPYYATQNVVNVTPWFHQQHKTNNNNHHQAIEYYPSSDLQQQQQQHHLPSVAAAATTIPTHTSKTTTTRKVKFLQRLRRFVSRSDSKTTTTTTTELAPSPPAVVDARPKRKAFRRFGFLFASRSSNHHQHSSTDPWQHRHARSVKEGIRTTKSTTTTKTTQTKTTAHQLRTILQTYILPGRHYAARTLTGLITALAEEVSGLEVSVQTAPRSPFFAKHILQIHIQFARLGFQPLKMGGTYYLDSENVVAKKDASFVLKQPPPTHGVCLSADEAFDRMDVDQSGALDEVELFQALSLATNQSMIDLKPFIKYLFELYDKNGDQVIDRKEYRELVNDMAALRRKEEEEEEEKQQQNMDEKRDGEQPGWMASAVQFVQNKVGWFASSSEKEEVDDPKIAAAGKVAALKGEPNAGQEEPLALTNNRTESVVRVENPQLVQEVSKNVGSITFSDMKMDLRRLFFGAIPLVKHLIPGGPLILEPFTTTISGSFSRDDIMNSFLLDAGLRRLVMRALRRRVGSVRDIIEGSMFRGRSWKTFGGEGGPRVEIPKLTNVEFDNNDKLIITGLAKVRTRPEAPVIEQKFKVRTSIGTRKHGRFIRLEEPELALVIECPESWEKAAQVFCQAVDMDPPTKPQPLYSFFPIYSPFKLQDDDGFDLGEDNAIKNIFIKDGALRFEMSAVLRPGRFLGSHYIAFTTPIRTLIVTLDRVTEGIKSARKNKAALKKQTPVVKPALPKQLPKPKMKSFFSRFVDGYLQAEREDEQEKFSVAIRDFFGKQQTPNQTSTTSASATRTSP